MENEFYRNIVIATDGSENTTKAISYGIEIAKLSGATVHALYVVDTSSFSTIPMDAGWEEMYEILRKEGERAIYEVERVSTSFSVVIAIRLSYPAMRRRRPRLRRQSRRPDASAVPLDDALDQRQPHAGPLELRSGCNRWKTRRVVRVLMSNPTPLSFTVDGRPSSGDPRFR